MTDRDTYLLRLGDDSLILSQQLGLWVTRAPELEEELALANIALDQLGQARALLAAVGDEDELAFMRSDREYLNLLIVEQPNGDFAQTIARQLLFSTFQLLRYEALVDSSDPVIAGVAGKAAKEVTYHREHASGWVLRLGDGSEESHRRMQVGLDRLWPYTHEMLAADELDARFGVDPAALRPEWEQVVDATLAEATLTRPEPDSWRPEGGRRGLHGEGLGHLLAEMQSVHRAIPGAKW